MHTVETKAPECVAYLALCFFAGLRPTNDAGQVTWGTIDLNAERITVSADISKAHSERFVKIRPNLKTWLLRYRLANKGPQVAPPHGTLVKQLRAVKKEAKVTTWPKDVARHTYASAFLELSQSIEETCL
jgi:integrase